MIPTRFEQFKGAKTEIKKVIDRNQRSMAVTLDLTTIYVPFSTYGFRKIEKGTYENEKIQADNIFMERKCPKYKRK